jgi:hypothetical protein
LNVKDGKNNISLYNNQGNKEVINEYGSKNNLFSVLEKQQQQAVMNPNKAHAAPPSSSLNKLFGQSNNNDLKNKTTSPNKVFIFKNRIPTKKD